MKEIYLAREQILRELKAKRLSFAKVAVMAEVSRQAVSMVAGGEERSQRIENLLALLIGRPGMKIMPEANQREMRKKFGRTPVRYLPVYDDEE